MGDNNHTHIGTTQVGTIIRHSGRLTVVKTSTGELTVLDLVGHGRHLHIGETVALKFSRFEISRETGTHLHGAGWALVGIVKELD